MENFEQVNMNRPFPVVPEPSVYFPASSIETARKETWRCLDRGEGISLIFGANGLGKTLLLRVLAQNFEMSDAVAIVSYSRMKGIKSLLQQILYSFHQNCCGCDESELRLMLLDYLRRSNYQRMILLVDDSQALPYSAFDEIRTLQDFNEGESLQVRTVLAGTPLLEEKLNHPKLAAFLQRVVVRSYLEPFEQSETFAYLDAELKRFGGWASSWTFSPEAKKAIHQLTGGVPRIVNQLSDYSLLVVRSARMVQKPGNITESFGASCVDEKNVQLAWNILQNLSVTSVGDSPEQMENDGGVVEFGSLNDDEDGLAVSLELKSDITMGTEQSPQSGPESALMSDSDSEWDPELTLSEPEYEIDPEIEARLKSRLNNVPEDTTESEVAPDRKMVSISDNASGFNQELDTTLDSEFNLMSDSVNTELKNGAEGPETESGKDEPSELDSDSECADIIKFDMTFRKTPENQGMPLPGNPENRSGHLLNTTASASRNPGKDKSPAPRESTFCNNSAITITPDNITPDIIVHELEVTSEEEDRNGKNEPNAGSDLDKILEVEVTDENIVQRIAPVIESSEKDNFVSLEDLAYEAIVRSYQYGDQTDQSAEDRYLNELRQLEAEVAQEANLIRDIRNLHIHLREAKTTHATPSGLSSSEHDDESTQQKTGQDRKTNHSDSPSSKMKIDGKSGPKSGHFSFRSVFRQIYND